MRKGTSTLVYLYIFWEISFSWGMHLPKPLTDLSGKRSKVVKVFLFGKILSFVKHLSTSILSALFFMNEMTMEKIHNLGKRQHSHYLPVFKKKHLLYHNFMDCIILFSVWRAQETQHVFFNPVWWNTPTRNIMAWVSLGRVAPCLVRIWLGVGASC